MAIKKNIYIFAFTVLGLLIGLLVKQIAEIYYLKLLLSDFIGYSFGLSWNELIQFNYVFTVVLMVSCGLWGYSAGKYWWKQIYVLKQFHHNRWSKFIK